MLKNHPPKNEWLYHLTRKSIALKIEEKGMTPAKTRIGRPVAPHTGAFAQNRRKVEHQKQKDRLAGYISQVTARGGSMENIKKTQGHYDRFEFTPDGNNDTDQPRLTSLEESRLKEYYNQVGATKKNDSYKFRQSQKDPAVKELAESLLSSNKNHFLARLAVQYESFRFKIEETITSNHIYFFTDRDATSLYKTYKDHLNTNDIVVLRVLKKDVRGLEKDRSDPRPGTMMTTETVSPDRLEVMVNHTQFPSDSARHEPSNWEPLSQLQ